MAKQISIIFLLLLMTPSILACSLYEHEKKGEVICQLKKGKSKVALYHFKDACEFPEGQKNECIYPIACNEKRTYRGSPILKGKKSLKALCLTAKKIKNKSTKNIFSRKESGISVDIDCSSIEKKPEIKLSIIDSTMECSLSKYVK
jgi:hypothetical protein